MLDHAILGAAGQSWPPFVLVFGLLLVGRAAADEGLFEALGARLARARLGSRGLLLALLALVAVVTAVLNLDTAVVFLTPVLVHAARAREVDERPFLYGSVFMANAGSLLLPGSNLTNLLVLRDDPQSGPASPPGCYRPGSRRARSRPSSSRSPSRWAPASAARLRGGRSASAPAGPRPSSRRHSS